MNDNAPVKEVDFAEVAEIWNAPEGTPFPAVNEDPGAPWTRVVPPEPPPVAAPWWRRLLTRIRGRA